MGFQITRQISFQCVLMKTKQTHTCTQLITDRADGFSDYTSDQLPVWSDENRGATPRSDGNFGAPAHSDEDLVPHLLFEEEEEEERHAFRPVEPARYISRGNKFEIILKLK